MCMKSRPNPGGIERANVATFEDRLVIERAPDDSRQHGAVTCFLTFFCAKVSIQRISRFRAFERHFP